MYHLRTALERSEVGYHSVPVMLRQGRGVIAAMLHEQARTEYLVDAFFRTALALHGSKVYLRQHVRKLILRVFAFGMELTQVTSTGVSFLQCMNREGA